MTHIVKIMPTSAFDSNTKTIPVYMPERNKDGGYFTAPNGSVIAVKKVGGVKVGSTGEIQGNTIKVPKGLIYTSEEKTPTLGEDLIDLIPVMFHEYKQLGYVISDNCKVIG